jgi:hypothetical protein
LKLVRQAGSPTMDNGDNLFQKLLGAGNSYWLTRFIILRLLGFVYAVAFLIADQTPFCTGR